MLKRVIAAVLMLLAAPALAQVPNLSNGPASTLPLPMYGGPFEASQGQLYLNNLIVSLNNTLAGTIFTGLQNNTTAVNMPTLGAGTTGQPVILGVTNVPGHTADANAGIAINPNGNGNVTLNYQQSTARGVLAFGSSYQWIAGNGVDACPGSKGGAAYIGAASGSPGLVQGGATVTGHIPVQDWLGRYHKVPACG